MRKIFFDNFEALFIGFMFGGLAGILICQITNYTMGWCK